MTQGDLDDLADEVRRADTVVALTGAGVSTASGLPSFRGDDGIWDDFDPDDFHIRRFREDPAALWHAVLDLHDRSFPDDPTPNAAHRALASLEDRGHLEAVVTQNVDGLHQRAGSDDVVEVHGSLRDAVCTGCGATEPVDDVRERLGGGDAPPRCQGCGDVLKPGGVLFGERLPEEAYRRAQVLAGDCDVLIVAGSSLTVEPVASLPDLARQTGAVVAVMNLDGTGYDDEADYVVRGDVTESLPDLEERV